jgi:[ribosomal protein S18]-alanine N-acetyltransferase
MTAAELSPPTLPCVVVRPARSEDVPRIERIERAVFSSPWSRASFESLLGRDDVDFWVLLDSEGEIGGYAIAWWIGAEGEVGNLAVAPEQRRQGCGGRLLNVLLERARAREVSDLYLEVRASNDAAQSLYRSRGFQPLGVRPNYYSSPQEDALVMHLSLPSETERRT